MFFFYRDLFIVQIGGDNMEVKNMWDNLSTLYVDWQGDRDKLIWLLESDGAFSIKSASNILYTMRNSNTRWKWMWSHYMPAKMSIFLWKIAWNAISVDANVQSRAVHLHPLRSHSKLSQWMQMFNLELCISSLNVTTVLRVK